MQVREAAARSDGGVILAADSKDRPTVGKACHTAFTSPWSSDYSCKSCLQLLLSSCSPLGSPADAVLRAGHGCWQRQG